MCAVLKYINPKLSESTLLTDSGFMFGTDSWGPMVRLFESSGEEERQAFIEAACAMPYKQYLRTVYWGVIRGRVVFAQPFCKNCRTTRNLQVHHVHYLHRGEEYKFLEDLEVVCGRCHRGHHGLASAEELLKSSQMRLAAGRYPHTAEEATPMTPAYNLLLGIVEQMRTQKPRAQDYAAVRRFHGGEA